MVGRVHSTLGACTGYGRSGAGRNGRGGEVRSTADGNLKSGRLATAKSNCEPNGLSGAVPRPSPSNRAVLQRFIRGSHKLSTQSISALSQASGDCRSRSESPTYPTPHRWKFRRAIGLIASQLLHRYICAMADLMNLDDEYSELKKLNQEVVSPLKSLNNPQTV